MIDRKITVEDWVAILWLLIVTASFILFFKYDYISFEQNDDMFISTIPSGIYGQHYIYICFSNILQGFFLSGLSKILPICNWTIILYIGYIYTSYVGIGVWAVETKGAVIGGCLSVLFFLATYDPLLHNMNFSKTGGVLMSVGTVIFAHYTNKLSEKNSIIFLLISGSMIFAGSLIRRDSIIAFFPFVMILIVAIVLQCKSRWNKVIKETLPWFILTLAIVTVWMIDSMAYKVNGEWRIYKEFNSVRSNLDDYGMLDYETHEETYGKIGWDSVDVKMLSTWHSADDEVFGKRNLQEIIQNKPSKEYSFENIKQSLEETYKNIIKRNAMFHIILILTLVCGLVEPKKLLLLVPNFLLMIAELVYLVFSGRYPERATLLVFMYAFAVIMYIFPEKEELTKAKNNLITVALLIMVAVGLYNTDINKIIGNNAREYPYKEEYRQFLSSISEHQENLYVWDIFAIERVLEGAYTPYEAFDQGVLSNSVYTGGWFVNTPVMANNAERFGEKNNPYKLLADSKNVYLVTLAGTDINDTLSYIRRHYNENAQAKCIAEINEVVIYRFAEE